MVVAATSVFLRSRIQSAGLFAPTCSRWVCQPCGASLLGRSALQGPPLELAEPARHRPSAAAPALQMPFSVRLVACLAALSCLAPIAAAPAAAAADGQDRDAIKVRVHSNSLCMLPCSLLDTLPRCRSMLRVGHPARYSQLSLPPPVQSQATPALVEAAVGYADAPVVQFPGPDTNLKGVGIPTAVSATDC